MSKTNIYNTKGENAGEIELSDKVFGVKINPALVHQAVVAQQANERQVLAHTKGRSDVRGGGKKPWKQKGTGRARQGSIRAPQWIGGGIVFGPLNTRNFTKKINLKMKRKAILMALSDRFATNNLYILENIDLTEYKTKVFNDIVKNLEKAVGLVDIKKAEKKNFKSKRSILMINEKTDEKLKGSGKNLVGVEMINLENINIVDILKYKNLVLTVEAVKKMEEKYSK